jgi:hypothetical protein
MHSLCTESYDDVDIYTSELALRTIKDVDIYSPEQINRAIKDWIESNDPNDIKLPDGYLHIDTVASSNEEEDQNYYGDDIVVTRTSTEIIPDNRQSYHTVSTSHSSGIVSSISMKPLECCCMEMPTRGQFSMTCFACVLCIPWFRTDVYIPTHSCQLLLCEGAGSYYNTHSIMYDTTLAPKYSLLMDCLCCFCCGHYYCCEWEWIKDGEFQCNCLKCNNEYLNFHRLIYEACRDLGKFLCDGT